MASAYFCALGMVEQTKTSEDEEKFEGLLNGVAFEDKELVLDILEYSLDSKFVKH